MKEKSDQWIGTWIKKISRAMNCVHDQKLEKYGLTLSQVTVLIQLWKKDGITQKDVQENLDLRPASVTGLVDVLTEKGFIVRRQDEEDGRLKRLYLTDAGRKLEDLSTNIIEEIEEAMTQGFSVDEKVIFLSWLKKVYDNLYT